MNLKGLEKFGSESSPAAEIKLEGEVKTVEDYVKGRVEQMRAYRKSLKVEEDWKEADKEYVPSSLNTEDKPRKRFESDDESGLRSRLVPVRNEDEDWRNSTSEPTLLTKIQTAISIIVGNNPDIVYKALTKQNEKRTALAKALKERNWNISQAKWMWIKYIFNLAKYGWAPARVYPRLVRYDKEVLTEVDPEDPSKNKYEKKSLTWYNDVDREVLNPYRTWIDEQAKPYDDYSLSECYYEKDYSYDQALLEFGPYGFEKFVPEPRDLRERYAEDGSESAENDELKTRQDIITIGFFESRIRDLYVIRIPKLNAVLHYCPMPNDDGYLSLFHAPWILRDSENPYGISLWKIISQKKSQYDKYNNMTMDQLVLSIMKMFFYTGTNNLIGDGKIKIKPGRGVQIINGKVDWMDVPGPGEQAWKGLQYLKNGMDDDSGVTPTLQGQVTGQTLGETQLAKEAALKRMKMPIENVAYAMEQDTYATLSWMGQVYSTPEVRSFASMQDIKEFEQEAGMAAVETVPAEMTPEGQAQGPFTTSFLPYMSLPLDKQGDKLVESRTERFFAMGKDIPLGDLKWRGLVKVEPKSIVSSSTELQKQGKKELFNILAPLLPQPPQFFANAAKELLVSHDEDPNKWFSESWTQYLQQDSQASSLFVPATPPMMPQGQPGMGQGVPSNQTSMQGAAGTTPGASAPTVVPQQQMNLPKVPGYSAAPRQELTRMQ